MTTVLFPGIITKNHWKQTDRYHGFWNLQEYYKLQSLFGDKFLNEEKQAEY